MPHPNVESSATRKTISFELGWIERNYQNTAPQEELSVELLRDALAQCANLSYLYGFPEAEWKLWLALTAKTCEWYGDLTTAREYAVLSDELEFARSIAPVPFANNKREEMHWIQKHLTGLSDYPGFANWTEESQEAAISDPKRVMTWVESFELLSYALDHHRYDFVAETIEMMAEFYSGNESNGVGMVARYPSFESEPCAIVNLLLRAGLPTERLSSEAKSMFAIALTPRATEPQYISTWLGNAALVRRS